MNSAGVQMTIHLSKHWLGMTEKATLETGNPIIVKISGKASSFKPEAPRAGYIRTAFRPLARESVTKG
jgi:hypothetical protein